MSDYCVVYLPFTRSDGIPDLPLCIRFPDSDSVHTSYELFNAFKSFKDYSVEYWETVPCVSLSGFVMLVDENGLFNDNWRLNVWASSLFQRDIVGPAFVLLAKPPDLDFLSSRDLKRLFSYIRDYLMLPSDFAFPDSLYSDFGLPSS